MITEASLGEKKFELTRFPVDQKNRSLQAWDSADEYLVEYVAEHFPDSSKPLILNDAFGALACYFNDKQVTSVSDSFVAQLATRHNLAANGLDENRCRLLDSLASLPDDCDLVLVKLPKNAGYLAHQLAMLSQVLKPGTPVIVGGKTKEVHTSTIKAVERFIGPSSTTLAVKKSRLIVSSFALKPQQSKFPVKWPLENTDFTIGNHANVFSRDSLDIGARFFINYLPQTGKARRILDLGCGNGVIGLMTLARCPKAKVTFVDESAMAVASARENVARNLPERLDDCLFVQNDCLSGFAPGSQDIVLCNPPFHQLQAVTDHIAWQMFQQAKDVLVPGGELRIIGNRHLDYHEKLKRLFGGYKLIGSNKKFVVLGATKRT